MPKQPGNDRQCQEQPLAHTERHNTTALTCSKYQLRPTSGVWKAKFVTNARRMPSVCMHCCTNIQLIEQLIQLGQTPCVHLLMASFGGEQFNDAFINVLPKFLHLLIRFRSECWVGATGSLHGKCQEHTHAATRLLIP